MNLKKMISEHQNEIILLVVILLLLLYPLRYVVNFISFPYPIEYREAASISAAVDFSNGINPYTYANYPGHIYLYGVLYPLLLAPFVNLVEHPLQVARVVDVVFLVLFLGISFWIFRKRNASIISSCIGVLLLLNAVCAIWAINGSRPDISGLFFAFLGLFFIFNGEPGLKRIFLSALFCVVSFYFKQYMLFTAVVAAVYLFLFVSKEKGYYFTAMVITLAMDSFIVARLIFPLYYEYSILHHLVTAGTPNNLGMGITMGTDNSLMIKQTFDFLRYYWILCLLYLFSLYKSISSFGFRRIKEIRLAPSNVREPLIRGTAVDLFDVGIFVSGIILTFFLGRLNGNDYTYYGELLLPFLLYKVIPKIDDIFKVDLHKNLVQVLILALCIFPFRVKYNTNFKLYQEAFTSLTQYADKCPTIYDGTPLVAMYKIDHKMYPLYNNGYIEYDWTIDPERTIFGKLSPFPTEFFSQRRAEWNNSVAGKIKNQEFACIFTEKTQEIKNYKLAGKIDKILSRTIYVWVPSEP